MAKSNFQALETVALWLIPGGDPEAVPIWQHGCYVDYENNVWLADAKDGIVQKYTHDGSKLLLQIGKSGAFDSSDGTFDGRALNSSHTQLNRPTGVAVDRSNRDIYISDGYGNSRVAVFDRTGKFLRQWVGRVRRPKPNGYGILLPDAQSKI